MDPKINTTFYKKNIAKVESAAEKKNLKDFIISRYGCVSFGRNIKRTRQKLKKILKDQKWINNNKNTENKEKKNIINRAFLKKKK